MTDAWIGYEGAEGVLVIAIRFLAAAAGVPTKTPARQREEKKQFFMGLFGLVLSPSFAGSSGPVTTDRQIVLNS